MPQALDLLQTGSLADADQLLRMLGCTYRLSSAVLQLPGALDAEHHVKAPQKSQGQMQVLAQGAVGNIGRTAWIFEQVLPGKLCAPLSEGPYLKAVWEIADGSIGLQMQQQLAQTGVSTLLRSLTAHLQLTDAACSHPCCHIQSTVPLQRQPPGVLHASDGGCGQVTSAPACRAALHLAVPFQLGTQNQMAAHPSSHTSALW